MTDEVIKTFYLIFFRLHMPDFNNAGLSPATIESIAGLSAGTVSTLTVHPLDVVKTRMQSMSLYTGSAVI